MVIYIAQEFQDGPSPSRWLVLRQKNIVAVCLLHNLAIHSRNYHKYKTST